MPRRIQQIYQMALVFKSHYAGGHANATLPFDLHKIAGGVLFNFVAFYGACGLYGSAKQQKLFGKGSFTGIGVADDGKGFAALYFFGVLHNWGAKVSPIGLWLVMQICFLRLAQ